MLYWLGALTAVFSYLLGCFNGSILVSKYVFHNDIREHGSGNAGLTNFYRTFGGPWTFAVIMGDVLKVVIAMLLSGFLVSAVAGQYGLEAEYWSAVFVVLGHLFPVFFRFRGGKGVLSAGTAVAIVDWRVFCLVMGLFILGVLITRWVSLGSLLAAIAFPIGTWLIVQANPFCIAMSALCGGLVVLMHRPNIVRLLRGEERRFQFSRK